MLRCGGRPVVGRAAASGVRRRAYSRRGALRSAAARRDEPGLVQRLQVLDDRLPAHGLGGGELRRSGGRLLGETSEQAAACGVCERREHGTEVPVDYRMANRAGRWIAYDVFVEGVSLVSNYRTQFNKIVQTESYDALVHRLRAKDTEPSASPGR